MDDLCIGELLVVDDKDYSNVLDKSVSDTPWLLYIGGVVLLLVSLKIFGII